MSWADKLYDLTPVEEAYDVDDFTGMTFKREDKFAPLGYGGINGSKLRQCIWLASEAKKAGYSSMVNGTVVGSPQSAMGAAVFNHFGMKTTTVLGATKPTTCLRHNMIKMAAWFGSDFDFVGSAYNSTIQPRCKSIADMEDRFYLEYGITLDHAKNSGKRVSDFHLLGGYQTKNIPDYIEDLIIPFGSANSTCSILVGLGASMKRIKNVHLVGIGPDKRKYLQERVDLIGGLTGLPNYTQLSQMTNILHYDLHGTGWVAYNDLMKESYGDIILHPRYEGKVMRYLRQNLPGLIKETSLFWIVGSEPSIEAMKPHLPELGEVPTSINLYEEEL